MQPLSTWQSLLVRFAGSVASGGGDHAALLVLIFHRVTTTHDPLLGNEPDAATFSAQMKLIKENFQALRLRDAVEQLTEGRLPRRAVCITFDDGYTDNFEIALPILTAHKIPATVFVAPGFLNGGRMFNDTITESIRRAPTELDLRAEQLGVFRLADAQSRYQAIETIIAELKHRDPQQREDAVERIAVRCGATLPTDLMMTDEQVRRLHRAGIDIGAHTMTHPILTCVDASSARREIVDSKSRLEAIIGAPVTTFAYPNGKPSQDYDATHVAIVRESGFDLALSTAWGAVTAHSDRYQIPRIAPWDVTSLRYAARMIRGYRQRNPVSA